MKKSYTELSITIGVYVVLAAFYFQMSDVPAEALGYPKFMLVASAVINTMLFIRGVYMVKKEESTDINQDLKKMIMTIMIFIAMMGIYIFLIEKISYIASTMFFIFASLKFLKVKSRTMLISLPICMTFLVYFIFTRLLMVSLPIGTWFYINL
ncbi:tripartite tricarboxylate transporter TctB family protein [Petroclostridium sp. X23]|uniref:tripartite tricarboxylate transporter TctB family protein n=1 Tax=Petroclostridium sp. X23 TaxID=3045146 RepID=UPI0024AC912C|nr:tripartite tricarboxylate transporter TctB family protein [Petroclostridium sp. X23]WHH60358.1 tripartite tricarboxylate transporter TctB family protein [Petroclostridium sp. X23]